MNYLLILGLIAAACTSLSFLPQAIKTIKQKSTKDISLGMYSIFCFGIFLWLIYGFLVKDIPLIIANVITFSLSFIILMMKLKFG